MNELKWAVLGTGVIANEMAQALHNMGRTLYGVCNRTYDKAVSFAKKYYPTVSASRQYGDHETICRCHHDTKIKFLSYSYNSSSFSTIIADRT